MSSWSSCAVTGFLDLGSCCLLRQVGRPLTHCPGQSLLSPAESLCNTCCKNKTTQQNNSSGGGVGEMTSSFISPSISVYSWPPGSSPQQPCCRRPVNKWSEQAHEQINGLWLWVLHHLDQSYVRILSTFWALSLNRWEDTLSSCFVFFLGYWSHCWCLCLFEYIIPIRISNSESTERPAQNRLHWCACHSVTALRGTSILGVWPRVLESI